MSENMTHVAVVEDCLNLMIASPDIPEAFKAIAGREGAIMKLASVTRSGDSFTSKLLIKYREAWQERRLDRDMERRLAFVWGWLCHRAADRQMKPTFREAEPNREYKPANCSIYDDAFLYKRFHRYNPDSSYNDAVFERDMRSTGLTDTVDVLGMHECFKGLIQHGLVSLQSLPNPSKDGEAWLEAVCSHASVQNFHIDIHRYDRIFFSPDPVAEDRYLVQLNFYNDKEPILWLIEKLRAGGTVPDGVFSQAVGTEPDSDYAKIVHTGYHYLLTAVQFFDSQMNIHELEEQFHIGQRGRDGLGV